MSQRTDHPGLLDELLQRLEQRSQDSYTERTYVGRALTRSDDSLHLATDEGVIAIPVSEITSVNPINETQPDAVAITVRRPDAVVSLIKTQPLLQRAAGPGGGGFGAGSGSTVTGSNCLDTQTVTAGVLDATDDTFGCSDILDDVWV